MPDEKPTQQPVQPVQPTHPAQPAQPAQPSQPVIPNTVRPARIEHPEWAIKGTTPGDLEKRKGEE